MYQIMCVLRLR